MARQHRERPRTGRFQAGEFFKQLGLKLIAPFAFGLAVAAPWALWAGAAEDFRVSIADGLGMAVLALVVTIVCVGLAYFALGQQVERLVLATLALVGGSVSRELGDPRKSLAHALADVVASGLLVVLAGAAFAHGVRQTHSVWVLTGVIGFALAGLGAISALAHGLLSRRLRHRTNSLALSEQQIDKSGEIPGVFVALGAVAVALSGAVADVVPLYRYAGEPRPLSYGSSADGCIGELPGCDREKVVFFSVDSSKPVELMVATDADFEVRENDAQLRVDASGQPLKLAFVEDSTYTRKGTFVPRPAATYSVKLSGKGTYAVMYRRAP